METLYLLYDGYSEDGMGSGKYCGRTTSKAIAKKHWDEIQHSPHSTGKVVAITDTEEKRIWKENDWVNFS